MCAALVERANVCSSTPGAHVPDPTNPKPQLWTRRQIHVRWRNEDGEEGGVSVPKPCAVVGSLPGCDVHLSHGRLPRRALYLHATDMGLFAVHLQEREKGSPHKNRWLDREQPLILGAFQITCTLRGVGPLPPKDPPDITDKLPDDAAVPHLLVLTKGEPIRQPIRRRLTLVGSGKPSKLRFEHASVDETHCVLYCQDGNLWAIDLLSKHGTFVDDRRVSVALLSPGCRLRLGECQMVFEPAVPATATPADDPAARYYSSRSRVSQEALARIMDYLERDLGSPPPQEE
jgi:hypothetical protein